MRCGLLPIFAVTQFRRFINVAFEVTGARLTLGMRSLTTKTTDGTRTSVFTKNQSRITTADIPEFVGPEESAHDDDIPLRDIE